MSYLRYSALFLVFLLVGGSTLAQNTPPSFTTSTVVYDVRENNFAEFNVRVEDLDGDPLTVSFAITSGHSFELDVTSASPGTGGLLFNRFTVPAGSVGSTIEVEATVTDGTDAISQTISFNVTGINYLPDIDIVVDGGSGLGTEANPFISPVGIGLGLNIDDQNSGFSPYGYNWNAVKLSGSFCPGATMLMWNADVEPGLLQVGRMTTGGRFRISHRLEDGANIATDEIIVWVDAAPDGCNPSSGLEDVSFSTNLPSNVAARLQSYQLIGRATSDSSVTFMMYAASTNAKPAVPLSTESRSNCSSGCTVQWSRVAPPYDTSQYYWLDVNSGGQSASRSLVVTVSGDGGGGVTPPPPTGCTGDSWRDCSSSCGTLSEFKVDAGCPSETILGGTVLELKGRIDTNQPQPFGEADWEIRDSAGLSSNELWIKDESDFTTELHTPEVTEEKTVKLRLNVQSTGCSCYDDIDVILIPDNPSGGTSADLSVQVDAKVNAGLGEEFDYRVTVTNLGPDLATGIVLTHSVPTGITFLSSDPAVCVVQGDGSLSCALANLPVSQISAIDFVFRGDSAGEVGPVVSVGGSQFDPVTSNNSRSLTIGVGASADLVLSISEGSESLSASVGQDVQLEFEVENVGPGVANNVLLTMSIPEGASMVSSEPQCQEGSSIICDLGTLDIDDTVTQLLTLKMSAEGTFNGSVAVSGDEFDPDDEDNEVSVEFIVTQVTAIVFPYSMRAYNPFPANRYIGIAVFNPNSSPTDVEFTGYSENGQELGSILLSEMEGRNVIPPKGQSAMLNAEILQGEDVASIIAKGTNGPVQLFFMLGDYSLTSLDGVAGPLREGQRLYFPIALSNATEATVMFLFNSSEEEVVDIALQLYNGNGVLLAEAARSLVPQGALAEELKEIFHLEEIDGYVKIEGDGVLKGFEVYSQGKGISALVAQSGEKVSRLVAPHYFANQNGNTSLRLQNVGQNYADVVIRGYQDNGTLVGEHAVRIQKGQRFVGSVTEFLPLQINGSDLVSGYLIVELKGGPVGIFPTDPSVIGSVTFTAFDGNTIATLPLVQSGNQASRFLHVAQADALSMYTGVAILNVSDAAANILVRVYDQNGQIAGEKQLDPLAAGARVVDLLNGAAFFQTGFEQVGGHIEIVSDQEIVIFALFGDYGGNFLSAIEGQITK